MVSAVTQTAAFEAAYEEAFGAGYLERLLLICTICPLPLARKWGRTVLAKETGPMTFKSNTALSRLIGTEANCPSTARPALFTRMSRCPKWSKTCFSQRGWLSKLVTSPWTSRTSPSRSAGEDDRHLDFTFSTASALMSFSASLTPMDAQRRARASPIPPPAPVMSATFPLSAWSEVITAL